MESITHSIEETKALAKEFAGSLQGGEVIALEGELGAGKTAFVQGLAEGLGVEGPVTSPTFSIMNLHGAKGGSVEQLVHLDLYRLESEAQLDELGLEEWLGQSGVVAAIEWPERASGLEPTHRVSIAAGRGPDERIVSIGPPSP
jgi:tRNA threonylcarbamoyladenosine biosynthesis protein TsaE